MQRQDSSLAGPFGHVVKFTGRAVSGWGGFAAVGGYFERIGVRGVLAQALPDGRTSPNQIAVADMAMGLFGTVLTGGRRFSHAERVRGDEVIKRSLGMERQPSGMTLTRYFGGLVAGQVQRLVEVLGSFVLGRVPGVSGGGTLDLDSTVIPRFGQQEGSLKGHNPQKHGRPSHHPLLAMLAEAKLIVHAWMRSGNTGTARGVEALLEEVLARLPEGLTISRIRADSGFFIASFFEALESKGLSYAVAVRMTAPVKRAVVGLSGWKDIGSGLEVAETKYETYGWKKARRLVVVRELLRVKPDARGRRLFELPDYTFHAVVTDLTLSPQDVWRFYNKRAESENRLKELKQDFGADGFCLGSFAGTEAVFQLNCFLFNLMALFKRDVLQDSRPQLGTLRHRLLVAGAVVGAEGRQPVLRLGLAGRAAASFGTLLSRLSLLPTVMQTTKVVPEQRVLPPDRWRPRGRRLPRRYRFFVSKTQ